MLLYNKYSSFRNMVNCLWAPFPHVSMNQK
jgi:hypothetical protein